MDVTDVLRDRMQRTGRAAADGHASRSLLHVALSRRCCSRRGGLLVDAADAPRDGHDDHARRRRRRPAQRRDDRDRRPAGPGADAAGRAPKREAGPAAGGEDAGDDGAAAERASRRRPTPRRRSSRRPTRRAAGRRRAGAEARPGSAVAETGARGQGFGLSTGGGAGIRVDARRRGDFCCPDYLVDDGRAHPPATGTSSQSVGRHAS